MTTTALSSICAALVLATSAGGSPAADAGTPTATGAKGTYLRTTVLLHGSLTRHAGNRHRLAYTHDWDGTRGQLTSYYCPPGATISSRWTSSRCVERSRRPVTGGKAGLSQTGRSAVLTGTITSRGWINVPLSPDLVWKQTYPTPMVGSHTARDET